MLADWLDRIHVGDARVLMRQMAADGVKVQTVITSPPYWGLRDYGVAGQIGLEPTPAEYVAQMVEVMRAVREVLTPDGTAWLNLGDSYVGAPNGGHGSGTSTLTNGGKWQEERPLPRVGKSGNKGNATADFTAPHRGRDFGLPPKNLVGIPWRTAFALQEDGWYLRQDIIWSKPNPMPESVRDRCTKSHEYLFLLVKSERYYFDQDAIREPFADASVERLRQDIANQKGNDRVPGKTNGPMKAVGLNVNRSSYKHGSSSSMNAGEHVKKSDAGLSLNEAGRNKRSVWTVTTQPYSGAHFATFPRALIEPCILAGSRPGDTVFDPFAGTGTTCEAALSFGRHFIGLELNPKYAALFDSHRSQQTGLHL